MEQNKKKNPILHLDHSITIVMHSLDVSDSL